MSPNAIKVLQHKLQLLTIFNNYIKEPNIEDKNYESALVKLLLKKNFPEANEQHDTTLMSAPSKAVNVSQRAI